MRHRLKDRESMADFTSIIKETTRHYDVRVRRWRSSMSGKAWRVYYHDGRVINWIESPQPKTPLSLAIFLHEVGHHAIGFEKYRYRCEEEFHVWMWAVDEMRRRGIEPNEKVHRRVELSMRYAVGKAMRRGIKEIPEALLQYVQYAA
ncbi:MAG TPA: hypothetical protein VGG44_11525 [Tepidisphaeraceae bacterium]